MSLRKLLFLVVACVLSLTGSRTFAQPYPSRPITVTVPFAAGGPTDTIARILGQRMSTTLGQSIVIENVTGAAGSIAVGRVVRAPPDGYTLSIGHIGTHVINGAIYPLQYDLLKDFEPIAMVASNPQLVLSKREITAGSLQELIAWIKARPNPVLIGTAGAGSPSHVSGAYLEKTLGISATMVPYRGAAPAMQALIAGQIDILFDQAANGLPQVRSKTVKAYAVTAKNPWRRRPKFRRWMRPGFRDFTWPYGTDCGRRRERRLMSSQNSMRPLSMRWRMQMSGQDWLISVRSFPRGISRAPQALGAFQKAEIEKWWPIIKSAGIKAE